MTISALDVTFLGLELGCIVLVVLAIVRVGFARLASSVGIAGDGLATGTRAPVWHLPDLAGRQHGTPSADRWQFLIFANRSLESFPDLVVGMHHLARAVPEVEVLVVSQDDLETCQVAARDLNLQVPIVPVDPAFYDNFRVRVMPFTVLLDPRGIARWGGLVNTEAQLINAWRMGRAHAGASPAMREV